MGVIAWFWENWFVSLQSFGIIGSLLFTAAAFRTDAKARRISNLITITDHHREIWTQLLNRPGLSRVLKAVVDFRREPLTQEEELFVNLLILHLNAAYHALSGGMLVKPEQLQKDIRSFFSLPIPRAVWRKSRTFQDENFATFVEAILNYPAESYSTRNQ